MKKKKCIVSSLVEYDRWSFISFGGGVVPCATETALVPKLNFLPSIDGLILCFRSYGQCRHSTVSRTVFFVKARSSVEYLVLSFMFQVIYSSRLPFWLCVSRVLCPPTDVLLRLDSCVEPLHFFVAFGVLHCAEVLMQSAMSCLRGLNTFPLSSLNLQSKLESPTSLLLYPGGIPVTARAA